MALVDDSPRLLWLLELFWGEGTEDKGEGGSGMETPTGVCEFKLFGDGTARARGGPGVERFEKSERDGEERGDLLSLLCRENRRPPEPVNEKGGMLIPFSPASEY